MAAAVLELATSVESQDISAETAHLEVVEDTVVEDMEARRRATLAVVLVISAGTASSRPSALTVDKTAILAGIAPLDLSKRPATPAVNLVISPVTALKPVEALNLWIIFEEKSFTVSFEEAEWQAPIDLKYASKLFTCTFPLLPENPTQPIFTSIAQYSDASNNPVPISHDASSPLAPRGAVIVQLSSFPTPAPCHISSLPVELLCLMFDFLDDPGECFRISNVCQLWKFASVPFWKEPDSLKEKYARLRLYPYAGRLWTRLRLEGDTNVAMVKEIIAGSPNVTEVYVDALWNAEEKMVVLNAIEALETVEIISFQTLPLEEVEQQGRGELYAEDERKDQEAYLQLPPGLTFLDLRLYPPIPSLSLPTSLLHLALVKMCPLPPSISTSPLPPYLEYVDIKLAPFYAGGEFSILLTPLDFSQLTNLTELKLDGGGETSNLVHPKFFGTLQSAKAIKTIGLTYCVVEWTGFPDFICWFFGDRRETVEVRDAAEEYGYEDSEERSLQIVLLFGEWDEAQIENSRRTMKDVAARRFEMGSAGVWESGQLQHDFL
ncbi:hypothetical protein BT69DRAFT_1340478 [Atractiella rhizophila]|nr:hypothetical protein BT69DRAFT_1340478 [Atractiella rhizophila]